MSDQSTSDGSKSMQREAACVHVFQFHYFSIALSRCVVILPSVIPHRSRVVHSPPVSCPGSCVWPLSLDFGPRFFRDKANDLTRAAARRHRRKRQVRCFCRRRRKLEVRVSATDVVAKQSDKNHGCLRWTSRSCERMLLIRNPAYFWTLHPYLLLAFFW